MGSSESRAAESAKKAAEAAKAYEKAAEAAKKAAKKAAEVAEADKKAAKLAAKIQETVETLAELKRDLVVAKKHFAAIELEKFKDSCDFTATVMFIMRTEGEINLITEWLKNPV